MPKQPAITVLFLYSTMDVWTSERYMTGACVAGQGACEAGTGACGAGTGVCGAGICAYMNLRVYRRCVCVNSGILEVRGASNIILQQQ